MMRVAGLVVLIAGCSLATVPEVSPIEETPAPQLRCPDGCATFFDGCNICGCDDEGDLLSCSRKFCTDKKEPKCMAFKEDVEDSQEDTSPPRQCPSGCSSWYDGCNDCSCAAPGKIGACTKRACITKAEEKCLKWEPKDDDLCPADCSSFFDGCNKCKCVNGRKVGCTKKYCPTKEAPKCLDADLPIGGGDEQTCPADCTSWFDGCNKCTCVNGMTTACTKKACLRKQEPKCLDADVVIPEPEPTDAVNPEGEATDVVTTAPEPEPTDVVIPEPEPKKCPQGCTNWFDGCNKCYCQEGNAANAAICTKKFCRTYEQPKCLDDEHRDVPDILRMTFSELQKFCWVNKDDSAECSKVCGKAKKGRCRGYKKAGKVKCKKIKHMGFCALVGCNASAGNRCQGTPNFRAQALQ